MMETPEILAVLRAQHDAIDIMLARCAMQDRTFFPSRSGPIWGAVVLGSNAIKRLEEEMNGAPTFECPACHAVSYHPGDIENRYCGRCHAYTGKKDTQ